MKVCRRDMIQSHLSSSPVGLQERFLSVSSGWTVGNAEVVGVDMMFSVEFKCRHKGTPAKKMSFGLDLVKEINGIRHKLYFFLVTLHRYRALANQEKGSHFHLQAS